MTINTIRIAFRQVVLLESLTVLKRQNVFGHIFYQEVDMIMAGITISKDRSEVVDFTFPFWTETSGVVVKSVDQREYYFFKSFRWQVSKPCLAFELFFKIIYMTNSMEDMEMVLLRM